MSERRIPGLDGVRGLAILAVIAYHTLGGTSELAAFGWAGVDLFFVLSGFLITGILLDARSSDRYFRTFYARRSLRIVPVYVVFLCACLALGKMAPAVQGWYWTFLVNVWIAARGWHDGPIHLWSLAVEEQFYLVWPLIVLRATPRTLFRLSGGAIVTAEAARIALLLVGADPRANYVLLPTRMDTLAVGAVLACAVRDRELLALMLRWQWWAAGCSGVALVAARVLAHSSSFDRVPMQVLGFPAIAILSGALILAVTERPTLLATPLLRFFGRYSYGIYLWHWLVIALLPQSGRVAGFAVVLLATTLVALASWHLLEAPFLRLKRLAPYFGVPR